MTNVLLNAEEKYQMYRVTSFFNRVIELNQKILILSKFLTKNVFFFILTYTTELFINKDVSKTDETLHDECIFKCRKKISDVSCYLFF